MITYRCKDCDFEVKVDTTDPLDSSFDTMDIHEDENPGHDIVEV